MPSVVIPDMSAAPLGAVANRPASPNLLGMGQSVAQLRGQILANQGAVNSLNLFQAKQAAGRAYLNALTANGTVDPAALRQNLQNSGNPLVGMAAPDYLASQAGLRNQYTQNQGMTLAQNLQRTEALGKAVTAWITLPPAQRTTSMLQQLVQNAYTQMGAPEQGASVAKGLTGQTPDETQTLARGTMAMGGVNVSPVTQMVNTGSAQFPMNVNPNAASPVGAVIGNGVANTLTPAEAASPVTLPTPSGANVVTTLGGVANTAATGQAPPIIASGITPSEQAAQTTYGGETAKQGVGVVEQASQLAPQRAMLQSIIAESGAANSGPIAGQMAKLGGVLQEFGIKGIDQATAYQLTQKSTMQFVGQSLRSMGVPTDDKLFTIEMATPNASMTPQAVHAAGGMLLGGMDYQQVNAKAWTQWESKYGPASYPQFQAYWNQHVPNAAAFQLQYLPPQIRARYIDSLTDAQLKPIADSMNWLKANGYLGQ